jgi:hypothetical protein
MPAQRFLTTLETTDFLLRHPLEADYIAKTKIAIATGVYDWSQTLPDWFLGLIPPWGTQVDDSSYGTVTIFFDVNGTLLLSGWTTPLADINKPRYVAQPFKCKDGSDPSVIGTCPEDFNILYWIFGVGVLLLIGFAVVEYRKR